MSRDNPTPCLFVFVFFCSEHSSMSPRYGLITEQKKGAYRYFADVDGKIEVVTSRTSYVDEVRSPKSKSKSATPHGALNLTRRICPQEREAETERAQILFGMDLGAPPADGGDEEGEDAKEDEIGTRSVPLGSRVFYTAEEVRSFRTLGLEPGECGRAAERAGRGIQSTAWCRNQALGIQGPGGARLRGQHQALVLRLPRRNGTIQSVFGARASG